MKLHTLFLSRGWSAAGHIKPRFVVYSPLGPDCDGLWERWSVIPSLYACGIPGAGSAVNPNCDEHQLCINIADDLENDIDHQGTYKRLPVHLAGTSEATVLIHLNVYLLPLNDARALDSTYPVRCNPFYECTNLHGYLAARSVKKHKLPLKVLQDCKAGEGWVAMINRY